MKIIKLKINKPHDEVFSLIADNNFVNSNVRFDEKRGIPHMHVKQKGEKIKIKCEMMGRPTKDNGFITGTTFWGRIQEKEGETTLSGVVMTSPIYHAVIIALVIVNIIMSIRLGGISIIPIFAIAFEIISL